MDRYPPGHDGDRHRYADVEAVGWIIQELLGAILLQEAWDRYGLPLAVTEAHSSCSAGRATAVAKGNLADGAGADTTGVDVPEPPELLGHYWVPTTGVATRADGFARPGV